MATSTQTLSLSEQVSNTLQSLTSRPGVESTLILSRKNGSIIKVAGALEDEPRHPKNGIASAGTLSPASATAEGVTATSIEDGDTGDEAMDTVAETGPTRAERLASDIFLFVSTASFVAASLESTASPKVYDAGYQNGTSYGHLHKGKTTAISEQEVDVNPLQLLRMRSKKHEIVIFPDPNFICCVVQSMERLAR
ncbi:hypothetical protein GJ744_003235 [Endocarpon pusillum]|uniref:Roadblock/LAMTOR2 domain-containing protein n=1 Tax=Endocarpon pusillum TaxID=364733 RepID=A0A8H7E002_9EURO|nr:hypothetical protein GJ744_003235 [Endocarpon pusillum]